MSDYFPKYGATLLNAVGVSRFEVTFDGECIYSSDDSFMDDGLLRYIAQLREQLAKAEAEGKRYREAWGRLRAYQVETVDSMESDANEVVRFIAAPRHRTTLKKMDDLIAPAEQGTNHD